MKIDFDLKKDPLNQSKHGLSLARAAEFTGMTRPMHHSVLAETRDLSYPTGIDQLESSQAGRRDRADASSQRFTRRSQALRKTHRHGGARLRQPQAQQAIESVHASGPIQGACTAAVVLPGEQRRGERGMLKEAGLGLPWGRIEAAESVRSNSEGLVGSSSFPDSASVDSVLAGPLS